MTQVQEDKPRVCIVDVDGTLIDSERRFKIAQRGNHIDWNIALDPRNIAVLDKPMPDNIVKTIFNICRQLQCTIIVLTGRPERLREITVKQLEKIGLKPDSYILIMRKDNDFRREVDFKLSKIVDLARRYRIVAIFDDNLEVLKSIKSVLREVRTYHVSKTEGVRELSEVTLFASYHTILDHLGTF